MRPKKGEGAPRANSPGFNDISHHYAGIVSRNTGRARGRFLRPEWFRAQSFDELGTFGRDALADEPSRDGDPPALPLGKLPPHAFLGAVSSSSDSDGVMSNMPHPGRNTTINWTAAATRPLVDPGPTDEDDPSSQPNSTKRPGGQPLKGPLKNGAGRPAWWPPKRSGKSRNIWSRLRIPHLEFCNARAARMLGRPDSAVRPNALRRSIRRQRPMLKRRRMLGFALLA